MFNFKRQEEVEFKGFPVYVGLAKVSPVAINPSLDTLKELGFMYNEEPVYKAEDFNKQPQTRLVIYLKHNNPDFTFPLTINISDRTIKSNDGSKLKVINAYGQSSYVTKEQYKDLATGKVLDNMSFFIPHGVRAAFEGEDEVIELIKNFKHIPMVSEKTAKEDLPRYQASFTADQFKAIVALDPAMLKALNDTLTEKDEDGSSFTFGVLLGARKKENGFYSQDCYRKTVKNYIVNNFDKEASTGWLVKEVASAQQNNHKQNTNFSLSNLKLREFKEDEANTPTPSNKDDMFEDDGFESDGFDFDTEAVGDDFPI